MSDHKPEAASAISAVDQTNARIARLEHELAQMTMRHEIDEAELRKADQRVNNLRTQQVWLRNEIERLRVKGLEYDHQLRKLKQSNFTETNLADGTDLAPKLGYSSDVSKFDCSAEQFRRLQNQASAVSGHRAVQRILWFIPSFKVPFYGGIYTILHFAASWNQEQGAQSLFAVCDAAEHKQMVSRIRAVYAEFDESNLFIVENPQSADDLPPVDVSICTFWKTAYYAAYQREVERRFYLVQDYEPAFYPAGSTSALVETTYRMGFYGIANTISLKRMYETEFGGKAIAFRPSIDPIVFRPREIEGRGVSPRQWLVFCYGRPTHPRNSFELLAAAMRRLKDALGERVRIVTAGEEWDAADYGLAGVLENLGLLAYEDTARLYRESDVGVVLMLTRHPSYIPLELMASGCLVVTNVNSWTSWLLKDGANCLLTQTTASAIAEAVERGLVDPGVRERITKNAVEMVRSDFLDWSSQTKTVYEYLCDPEGLVTG